MLRTPAHRQLQREYWPYHCRDFMTYLGEWHQEDFEQLSPGSGFNWFGRAMGHIEGWEDMWDWLPSGLGRSYVYTCLRCGEYKVYVDSD
jgi:uncharacterized protein CbrC (UPF0167 family)